MIDQQFIETWHGRVAIVTARGDVDLLSSPQLRAVVQAALQKGPTAVIVDLSDADFLASAGMQVLVDTRYQCDELVPAVPVAVVADGPATSRPMTMIGLTDLLDVHPSMDTALANLGE